MKTPGQLKFEKHVEKAGTGEKWEDLTDELKQAWEDYAVNPTDDPPPCGPGLPPCN